MVKVSIAKAENYEEAQAGIRAVMEPLGGFGAFKTVRAYGSSLIWCVHYLLFLRLQMLGLWQQ